MSEIKNGGLDQYGAGPFEQQQFGTAGVEGVNSCASVGVCSGLMAEHWTRNQLNRARVHLSPSPLQATSQVANLLFAQANSGSYPQRDEK